MTEYITGERELLPGLTVRSDLAELVRCRDCANASRMDAGGPLYCVCWSGPVPSDGYCHLGERSTHGVERSRE